MAIKNQFIQRIPVHPGKFLSAEIEALKMTQKEFAERVNLTQKNLSEIINGKASITADTAIAIGSALGSAPNTWLALQSQYDELVAQQKAQTELVEDAELASCFPYAALRKVHPSIPKVGGKLERVDALRAFLCTASLKNFCANMSEFLVECPYFRTTGIHAEDNRQPDKYALACWLRLGQIQATSINVPDYCEAKLKHAVPHIKRLSARSDVSSAWNSIRNLLTDSGVKVALIPYLPNTYVNGAMYWHGQNPVIVLNAKTSYWDTMMFSLLHEIAHILKHGRRFSSISFQKQHIKIGEQDQEREADDFAEEALLPEADYKKILALIGNAGTSLPDVAARFNVDLGVLAGRLAHEGKLSWSNSRQYRRQVQIIRSSEDN